MKTWIHVEKAFQDAGISYEQKDWVFLCEIESGEFYYSPQSGKWRVKGRRAWQTSNSVEEFIKFASEYIRREKEPKKSPKARQKKKKSKKKTSGSQSRRQYKEYEHQQKTQNLRDEVRPEFLDWFDEKVRICNVHHYKQAWIWKVLLDRYLLTAKEICWLCTVFGYDPGWAYHQTRDQHPGLTYEKILVLIGENREEWLKCFNSRWHFASKTESKEEESRRERNRQQDYQRQKYNQRSTQPDNGGGKYQNHLHLLQLKFPFSRQELKTAYRKKARSTHPDTGGTTEAFRKVHTAFEILSALAG